MGDEHCKYCGALKGSRHGLLSNIPCPQIRIDELEAENAALREEVEQNKRDGKRLLSCCENYDYMHREDKKLIKQLRKQLAAAESRWEKLKEWLRHHYNYYHHGGGLDTPQASAMTGFILQILRKISELEAPEENQEQEEE